MSLTEEACKLKPSLEDAIRLGTESDDIEEKVILINRRNFGSRKRGLICEISRGISNLPNDDESCSSSDYHLSEDEATLWKRKYTDLKEKYNDAETDLQQAQNKIIELESQLKQKEMQSCNQEVLKRMNEMLKFYEIFTSMTVSADIDGRYVCTLKNKSKKRATRFILCSSQGHQSLENNGLDKEFDFKPVVNADLLPEYLQNHIVFDADMAPIVLEDVIHALYTD